MTRANTQALSTSVPMAQREIRLAWCSKDSGIVGGKKKRKENQERMAQDSCQNLQVEEQFSPPAREPGKGEKPQEGESAI